MRRLFLLMLMLILNGCGTYTYRSALDFSVPKEFDLKVENWEMLGLDCSLIVEYKNKLSIAVQPSFIFDVYSEKELLTKILFETSRVIEPDQNIRLSSLDSNTITNDLTDIKCDQIKKITLSDIKYKDFEFRID